MKESRIKIRSNSFLAKDQVDRNRWADVVKHLLTPVAGTLWWVEESLWQKKLAHYDRKSTRLGHPGLSAMKHPVVDLFSQVPLFHGTSGDRGPVVVGQLDPMSPGHKTSFGHLVAPAVPAIEWTPLGERQRVRPNHHKPRLNQQEQVDFLAFLQKRGLA